MIAFEFTDSNGAAGWLSDLYGYRALVLVTRDTGYFDWILAPQAPLQTASTR